MTIERKLLGKTSRVLRAWACSITLCLGVSACISPDLEPPRGSPDTSLPATPNTPQDPAQPANGVTVGAGGSAANPGPGTTGATEPPTTTMPPTAAAGHGANTTPGANPQTPGKSPTDGAAGAASEAGDGGDADAGTP